MERYTLVKKIGTGSYGSAYLVKLKTDSSVQLVLKKIRLDNVSSKERAAALQEVKLLAQLNHPYVLGYIESFQHKNHLCIITEFCEGGDLYTRLKQCKSYLKEEQIMEWFLQIAMAMQYIHSKKVLHRDLKTQNVFLTKDGQIRLGDFGIARVLNAPVEMAMTVIGTPYYMSPEVMDSRPYDFKSDIWSLGCVLYEMTSLKHAFDAQDMNGLIMKILRGSFLPLPPHYSSDLRALIGKLLAKAPSRRPDMNGLMEEPVVKNRLEGARAVAEMRRQEQVERLERYRAAAGLSPAPAAKAPAAAPPAAAPAPPRAAPSAPAAQLAPPEPKRVESVEVQRLKERLRAEREQREQLEGNIRKLQEQRQARNAARYGPGGRLLAHGGAMPAKAPSAAALGRVPPNGNGAPGNAAAAAARREPVKQPGVPQAAAQRAAAAAAAKKSHIEAAIEEKENMLAAIAAEREKIRMQAALAAERERIAAAAAAKERDASEGRIRGRASDNYLQAHRQSNDGDRDPSAGRNAHGGRDDRRASDPVPQHGYGGRGAAAADDDDGQGGHAALSVKERREAKKQEENRKREQELLEARKTYYEERKKATERMQSEYSSSLAGHGVPGGAAAAAGAGARGGNNARDDPYGQPRSHSCGVLREEDEDEEKEAELARLEELHAISTMRIDQLQETLQDARAAAHAHASHHGAASPDGSTEDDEEEVAQRRPEEALDRQLFTAGGPRERIVALRQVCERNLGPSLFEKLYVYLRERLRIAQQDDALTDEAAFRAELRERLGAERFHYVALVDRLLYEEEVLLGPQVLGGR